LLLDSEIVAELVVQHRSLETDQTKSLVTSHTASAKDAPSAPALAVVDQHVFSCIDAENYR